MKIEHVEDYNRLRREHYPPLADFADALYHQSQGNPDLLEAYLQAVEAVKVRYPKLKKDSESEFLK